MSARRQSRRVQGEDPEDTNLPASLPNQEMKMLLAKGGANGKINPKHADWNFSPQKRQTITSMISVRDLNKELQEIRNHTENQVQEEEKNSTYVLLHVNQMKCLHNFNCKTCETKDKRVRQEIKTKTYGMASAINLLCSECKEETEIPPKSSSFAGKGLDGEPSRRRNNMWYEANIRLVLATLAVGNGGSDLSDFAAILDPPQASSFGKRAFNRIESMIGIDLQEVAEASMNEAMEKEAKMTLEATGKSYEEWKKQPIEEREKIPLTVSFDMG